jgi:hypothetical protein
VKVWRNVAVVGEVWRRQHSSAAKTNTGEGMGSMESSFCTLCGCVCVCVCVCVRAWDQPNVIATQSHGPRESFANGSDH